MNECLTRVMNECLTRVMNECLTRVMNECLQKPLAGNALPCKTSLLGRNRLLGTQEDFGFRSSFRRMPESRADGDTESQDDQEKRKAKRQIQKLKPLDSGMRRNDGHLRLRVRKYRTLCLSATNPPTPPCQGGIKRRNPLPGRGALLFLAPLSREGRGGCFSSRDRSRPVPTVGGAFSLLGRNRLLGTQEDFGFRSSFRRMPESRADGDTESQDDQEKR